MAHLLRFGPPAKSNGPRAQPDVLLGIWLVVSTTVMTHISLVGQTKAFKSSRYIYFLEGLVFIGLTILLHKFGGITMMLGISIACSLSFTFPYALYRTRECFKLTWPELAGWHKDTFVLAGTLAPVGAIVWWLARSLPPLPRLIVVATLVGAWTAWMFLRYGLADSLRTEACRRAPAWARPVLLRAGFAKE